MRIRPHAKKSTPKFDRPTEWTTVEQSPTINLKDTYRPRSGGMILAKKNYPVFMPWLSEHNALDVTVLLLTLPTRQERPDYYTWRAANGVPIYRSDVVEDMAPEDETLTHEIIVVINDREFLTPHDRMAFPWLHFKDIIGPYASYDTKRDAQLDFYEACECVDMQIKDTIDLIRNSIDPYVEEKASDRFKAVFKDVPARGSRKL